MPTILGRNGLIVSLGVAKILRLNQILRRLFVPTLNLKLEAMEYILADCNETRGPCHGREYKKAPGRGPKIFQESDNDFPVM